MFKRLIIVATTLATVALASGAAGVASADPLPSVDFFNCTNSPDPTPVPAGTQFTVTDIGASATGNYGTALHGYQSSKVTWTLSYNGGPPTPPMPLVGTFPQYVGDPFYAWMSFLPDIGPLGPLASGDSVLVTIDYTNTVAGETVFPGQGNNHPHFGPFHNDAGTTEYGCFITAS
jgi:hypothetical protein